MGGQCVPFGREPEEGLGKGIPGSFSAEGESPQKAHSVGAAREPDAVKDPESSGACLWGPGEAGRDDDLTRCWDYSGEGKDRVTQLSVQHGSIWLTGDGGNIGGRVSRGRKKASQ